MARWLLDCRPLCGRPWQLGLAQLPEEREKAYRLRYDVFFREMGYRQGEETAGDGRDVDSFDEWCDHLVLYDNERDEIIGTYRAIYGAQALRRGGLYGADEFDMSPLEPIAGRILQGGRTCVAIEFRTGPAFQYLSYGMEILAREYDARYFLGAESFRTEDSDTLNRIDSYVRRFGMDPNWSVQPLPANRVAALCEIPVTEADERQLPSVVRWDLRMGFRACGPLAWDPDFRCYDLLMLGDRTRLSPFYRTFVERIERNFSNIIQ